MSAMADVAATALPDGYGYEWSGLSFQENRSSGQEALVFALAFLFAYLFLVAQYESWSLPLVVIVSLGQRCWVRSQPSACLDCKTASMSRSRWCC